jgi:catechol 2,3-dioxygenase-like lactoylglutathione lyase family enzyme
VSPPIRLDHVVIVVGDRSRAAADYADLGFESAEASARRYAALLGRDAEAAEGGRLRIDLGDAAIRLAEPVSADDPVRAHLARRGEGPFALMLGSEAGSSAQDLPFAATHGARLEIRPSQLTM